MPRWPDKTEPITDELETESSSVAVLEREAPEVDAPSVSRRRLREQGRGGPLRPIEQIRMAGNYGPGVDAVGAWSYWLRKDGETIADALILSPNGGRPPLVGDEKQMRRRRALGNNSEYFRAKQEAKRDEYGNALFEFVGHSLNESGVRRLVEILMENREDGILYAQESIEQAEHDRDNADKPEYRQQARTRLGQWKKRLAYLEQEIDPESLLSELNEISRAQRLRALPAGTLAIINEVVGEAESRIRADIADKVANGRSSRAYGKGMKAAAANLGEVDDE